jgi:hypothetical protein
LPPRRPTLKKSLRAIERALAEIERLFAKLAERERVAERAAGRQAATLVADNLPRPRIESPKRRAQRKLHGSYIGHLRHLKPAQKLRVKAVKETRGFEAAIRVAKRLAKG